MTAAVPSPLLLRAGLRYQARHPWQAALALIGIVMGVAVVLAVDIANQSARAAFALSAEQLRGAATHRLVSGAGNVPSSVYRALATTPGHPPMAPVVQARVALDGHAGRFRLVGLDIFAEGAFRSGLPDTIRGAASLADWLARRDALAVSQAAADALGLQPGAALTLRHQGTPQRFEVVAVSADDSAATRDLLVTDIATAQAFAGLGDRISHIDLKLDAGAAAWVRERIPAGVELVSIDDQTRGVVGLSAAFELNLTAMSLLALLVGMFLIFNAVSFSIVQRRRLLGRLRAIGVRRDEIARLVMLEAFVLALIGTLVGLGLGIWLGQGLTVIVAATVSDLYYGVAADAATLTGSSLLKAILLGIAGTLAAAWWPARQAAATPPLTTLSRQALEQSVRTTLPYLGIGGALLVVVGLGIAFGLPGGVVTGFAGLFIVLLGAALLCAPALHVAYRLLRRLPLRGIWRMAARDLDRHLSRLGTAAAALMVALAASVGIAVMVESMRGAVSDWLNDLLTADLYVAADAFEEGAPLPVAVARDVPRLAPVTAYSRYRDRDLQLASGPVRLVGARLAAASRAGFRFTATADGDPWDGFDQGGVLVSEPLANRAGLVPGGRLHLPTPAGPVEFEIAGVFRDFASEHGRLFVDYDRYRSVWNDDATDTLALFADGGAAPLRQAVDAAFGARYALAYTPARAIYDESMAVFDRTFRITEVLRILSLGVAFIGVFSALMAMQLERRKEYAVLRALGLTRREVVALILLESSMLGLLAALLALPTGIAMAWVLTDAIQLRAFGWTLPFAVDIVPLLLTLALGLVAALLAGIYPAQRSAWHAPAAQLRED